VDTVARGATTSPAQDTASSTRVGRGRGFGSSPSPNLVTYSASARPTAGEALRLTCPPRSGVGEVRLVPHAAVHLETHEPAEHPPVLELLRQSALAQLAAPAEVGPTALMLRKSSDLCGRPSFENPVVSRDEWLLRFSISGRDDLEEVVLPGSSNHRMDILSANFFVCGDSWAAATGVRLIDTRT